MPENYEVKRICSYLQEAGIEGKAITKLELLPGAEKILKGWDVSIWKTLLANQHILLLTTKAKYTFLQLDQGTLVWHYRFTGIPHITGINYGDKLYTIFNLPVDKGLDRFCRFRLHFENETILQFIDIRCLSEVKYYPNQKIQNLELYQKLAPDLAHFVPELYSHWKRRVRTRKRDIKQELQDQFTTPSGIGNYLACEILAYAQLYPWLPVTDVTQKHYDQLCQGIETVRLYCTQQADYSWFRVFKRKTCRYCNANTIRIKHRPSASSQTTHFCPKCQKKEL